MHGRARIMLSDLKVENILIRCRETTATKRDIIHLRCQIAGTQGVQQARGH